MRVGTRLLILKLALAAAVLAVLLIAMHLLLPGLLGRGGQPPAHGPVSAETRTVRVAVPRAGGNLPAGSRLAVQVAAQVESFLQGFRAELGPALGLQPLPDKLAVHVVGSHAEASAFAQENKLRPATADPGAFYSPESCTLVVTLRPYPELAALIVHVATRLLVERAGGAEAQWSPWLEAGLAACAEQEGFRAAPARPSAAIGRDAYVVLSVTSRGAHVPLHMLLRGGDDLFRGQLGPLACREAGLLVFFLLRGAGPSRREAFLGYLRLERQPGPVAPGALEAALGTATSELEREWSAFLRTMARA